MFSDCALHCRPELSKLQTDHERLVETLNAEVSQRTRFVVCKAKSVLYISIVSSMKIVLNETEEKLRETNTQVSYNDSCCHALAITLLCADSIA